MSNQNNQKNNVKHAVKEGAGAAFHSAHQALEATENAAMTAVDKTSEAVSKVTDNDNKK